jgi:hypothetical protein
MKKLFASACVLALLAGGVFAQTLRAKVTSVPARPNVLKETTIGIGVMPDKKTGAANPSSEGNVGPSTNNNSGKQPGAAEQPYVNASLAHAGDKECRRSRRRRMK